MKKAVTILLQAAIALIGIAALAFMLWMPHLEGRNAHATLFEIYFKDPFLAFAYIASIPFFLGLHQAFKALACARQNRMYSQEGVNSMRTLKYCAMAMIGFVALSVVFMIGNPEDRPQAVVMRAVIALPSIIVAVAAAMLERNLRNAVAMRATAA